MMTSSNGNIFRVNGPLCSSVTGEFLSQRPVMRSIYVFVDLSLNKRLSKQFESNDLIRHHAHYDVIVMILLQFHFVMCFHFGSSDIFSFEVPKHITCWFFYNSRWVLWRETVTTWNPQVLCFTFQNIYLIKSNKHIRYGLPNTIVLTFIEVNFYMGLRVSNVANFLLHEILMAGGAFKASSTVGYALIWCGTRFMTLTFDPSHELCCSYIIGLSRFAWSVNTYLGSCIRSKLPVDQ